MFSSKFQVIPSPRSKILGFQIWLSWEEFLEKTWKNCSKGFGVWILEQIQVDKKGEKKNWNDVLYDGICNEV